MGVGWLVGFREVGGRPKTGVSGGGGGGGSQTHNVYSSNHNKGCGLSHNRLKWLEIIVIPQPVKGKGNLTRAVM